MSRSNPTMFCSGLGTLGVLALLGSHVAWGHSLLVVPQPRDQQDGYKDPPRAPPGTGAPCGVMRMAPPTQPQTTFAAGQKLNVQWKETINHPGCFVVDFANASDTGFTILGVKSHAGAVGAMPRSWNVDVVLPSAPCPACTLRLRQLMLTADVPDAMCPPATIPAGDTYYSCSNVILTGADAGTADVGGGAVDGATASGGAMGRGGAMGSGGSTGSGGSGSGMMSSTGGVKGSGGTLGTGGSGAVVTASGGTTASATGGSTGPGQESATGGHLGTASGGTPAGSTGGGSSGGCAVSGDVRDAKSYGGCTGLLVCAVASAIRRRRSGVRAT